MAATFFVIALIAALLGFTGLAGSTTSMIVWTLFAVALFLAVVFFVLGRR